MEGKLQRRVQRYGWDLAANHYEPLWRTQLAGAQARLVECARFARGERVLDVACGTGLVTLSAAEAVGGAAQVVGIDLSEQMVDAARRRAADGGMSNATFARMDGESLEFPDAFFDVALCALGLMYMPEPARAVREMRRVLRPGGRMVVAVWGERSRCGWSELFPIVDAEVESDVCPLFFRLGIDDELASLCADSRFTVTAQHRFAVTLDYADGDAACNASFLGGPVALSWSRFDERVRARVCTRFLESIEQWRCGRSYRIPGEFVIVAAAAA